MASRRAYRDISYGEMAVYEHAVDAVRKEALAIAKDTRDYERESGMSVTDGEIYAYRVRAHIAEMQKALRKIDSAAKRYGRSRTCAHTSSTQNPSSRAGPCRRPTSAISAQGS